MSNLNGDDYSRALKTVGGLEKASAVELLRPYASIVEKYFGLPVTPNDVENWDYPIYGMYRLILSEDISPELFELFSLLAFITNDLDCDEFKTESYRHKGIKKLPLNPSLRFAGRIAQIWHNSTEKEKRLLLGGWRDLTANFKKFVTYRYFPLTSSYKNEEAADPLAQPDFLKDLGEELQSKRAIPKGTSVLHKRIRDEDWFWFVLCAQNGKVCLSCCSHPGVVVYNRRHRMLRTSNIKRDVHHLSCIIHCFSTAFFNEEEAFVTMNKKLMKHFNIWGIQRLSGEREETGRPELVSMSYATYDTSGEVAECGTGPGAVKKLSTSEEVGYVQSARFNMSMRDENERVCRKQFNVHAGNKLEFERGCEEDRVLDWLVKMKIVKVGAERDNSAVPCGDIAKRVKWMENSGLLSQPCALWQFKELFGSHFSKIEKHLLPAKDAKSASHYRIENGATMKVLGGLADGRALWEGRVKETATLPAKKKELKPYTLSLRGQSIAKKLVDDHPPAKPGTGGRQRRNENADDADRKVHFREIEKRIGPNTTCNAACEAVCKKFKLNIDPKSLSRDYRRCKNKRN
jgi:hypothetical protein